MTITTEDVRYIANLAQLEIDEQELPSFVNHMSEIVEYFNQLSQLETDTVSPTYNVLDLTNVTRPDEIRHASMVEMILENAPKKDGHFFCVPTTVEKKAR